MGPVLLALALVAPPDSAPYADAATRALVDRARARHAAADTAIADYRARATYRFTYGVASRRQDAGDALTVEQQEAVVRWRRPNDLRIDIVGKRVVSRIPNLPRSSLLTEPWFVPVRAGDSLRIFTLGFPERAALHPLAADGPDWYRYALVDSVRIVTPAGERLLLAVDVLPAREGDALVTGRLWLEAGSAEVVRLMVRFVGRAFYAAPEAARGRSDAEAGLVNALLNRTLTLEADLEYGLEEGRLWVPYRQVIRGRVSAAPLVSVTVPFEVETRFREHALNTGESWAFSVEPPDSAAEASARGAALDSLRRVPVDWAGRRRFAGRWAGGRWEIARVARDSLWRYQQWEAPLTLADGDTRAADEARALLAGLAARLPGGLGGTSDVKPPVPVAPSFRFTRVQGFTPGVTLQRELGPAFWLAEAEGRAGLNDGRLLGAARLVRDAPASRIALDVRHDLAVLDPYAREDTFGASLRAMLNGRDEHEWHLATGVAAGWEGRAGRALGLELRSRVERHRTVANGVQRGLASLLGIGGGFAPNAPAADGWFWGAAASLRAHTGHASWRLTGDVLAGTGRVAARLHGSGRWDLTAAGLRGVKAQAFAGLTVGDSLPQALFRAGGLGTVRGFGYGVQRGPALWVVRADWAIGRRFAWQPYLFANAGRAARARDLLSGPVLVGAGGGIRFFGGLARLELALPLTGSGGLRFDEVLGGGS
ncbi:MAG: hypothetical protein NW201_01575 [Gemmatimonadales bacterium]|nr:hypothetical protein [Gemmatimonadales bacterium]